MKKALWLFLSLVVFLLTSCENFMNGSDVQNQLNELIDVANAKSCTMVVSQDNTMGSFLSSGDKICKLGYSIEVQFTVKKESYIFKGLKAVNKSNTDLSLNEYVEFTTLDSDENRGTYKVSIKLIKETNDILIEPDCVLIPNVVTEKCLPVYSDYGCDQDTTVVIAFNKPVVKTPNFTLSITDSSGDSMSAYFGEPYFSSDSKTLYIPTNKSKRILELNGTANNRDIYIKIDLSNIKDESGNYGAGVYQHKYRVNKQYDTVKPVLTDAKVYSTQDTTSPYYKAIVAKNPSQWSSEGDGYGDYGKYHVSGNICIELTGTDVGGGIGSVLVKEKLLKYADGSDANADAVAYHGDCIYDETKQKYYCNYKLNTTFDGIIELEIFAEDFASNVSTASKKYWVLKDSIIDSNLIHFNEEVGVFPNTVEGWLSAIPIVDGEIQDVKITLSDDSKDTIFGEFSSDYTITAAWGYGKSSITNPITIKNNVFTFQRDVNRSVYIKLTCTDEVGNEKEIIKSMDPRPVIDSFYYNRDVWNDGIDDHVYLSTYVDLQNFESLKIQNNVDMSSINSYVKLIYYVYDNTTDSGDKVVKTCPIDTSKPLFGEPTSQWIARLNQSLGTYTTKPFRVYFSSFCGDFMSPMSSDYIRGKIASWPESLPPIMYIQDYDEEQNRIIFEENFMPEHVINDNKVRSNTLNANIQNIHFELGPYLKDNITITTEEIKNGGCYKITIDDYLTEAGKTAKDVSYVFKAEGMSSIEGTGMYLAAVSYVPELTVQTPASYNLFIYAIDKDGAIYAPFTSLTDKPEYMSHDDEPDQDIIGPSHEDGEKIIDPNDEDPNQDPNEDPIEPPDPFASLETRECFSFKVDGGTETKRVLKFTKDLSPPNIGATSFTFDYCNPGYFDIAVPIDGVVNNESTLYKNKAGEYELTYYLIPIAGSTLKQTATYTIEELEEFYSGYARTITYDPYHIDWQSQLHLTYGDLTDGLYYLCITAKDQAGNYTVQIEPIVNRLLGKFEYEPEIFDQGDYKDINFTFNAQENDKGTISKYYSAADGYESTGWMGFGDIIINSDNPTVYISYEDPEANFIFLDSWFKVESYRGFAQNDLNAKDVGYYYTDYFYTGIDRTCKSKNCVEGVNGVQIFCDNAAFVHTMYSKDKITKTTDGDAPYIWASKGFETGVFEGKGNFTYGKENFADVPDGYWYTTVVHFVDGTAIMTDIKQK